jgi:hypothetical protein
MSARQAELFRIQADQTWSGIDASDLVPDDTWVVVRDNHAYHTVHRFHPYFAMCPPPIARMAIERFSQPGDVVGDPFCGAGVTMVESMLTGRHSVGVDILSIAALISKVKTTLVDLDADEALQIADDAEQGSRPDRDFDADLPPITNVDYWFTHETQRQLGALLSRIQQEPDADKRDFYRIALSGIVRPVSHAGNLEAHLHIKVGKPAANAFRLFRKRVFEMVTREEHFRSQLPSPTPRVTIFNTDCRDLTQSIPDENLDFIFTSPPYGNGTKYASVYRLQLELLGLSRPKRPLEAAKDFSGELTRAFAEMHRMLKPGKTLAVLYGTNKHLSSADVAEMASSVGFSLETTIACPVIDESKMVRGDYRRSMANEHLIVLRK